MLHIVSKMLSYTCSFRLMILFMCDTNDHYTTICAEDLTLVYNVTHLNTPLILYLNTCGSGYILSGVLIF